MSGLLEGGAAWPPAAIATVTAAVLGASVSIVVAAASGVWAAVIAIRTGRFRRREQYWQRLSWALELVCRSDVEARDIGLVTLKVVRDISWATDADLELGDEIISWARGAGATEEDTMSSGRTESESDDYLEQLLWIRAGFRAAMSPRALRRADKRRAELDRRTEIEYERLKAARGAGDG